MKQSEALRIPSLLAARRPRPFVEEADIDGIRMLVITGVEVDTVIQFTKSGGAKMPQLATYPEVAESTANADERLARQRASGGKNTTGEGVEWPYNWKLADAKAAGKIWYTGPRAERKAEIQVDTVEAPKSLSHPVLNVEELLMIHAEYVSKVPNNYGMTMARIEKNMAQKNVGEIAQAVSEWVKSLNQQFYRFHPGKKVKLRENLEPLLAVELVTLLGLRARRIATLTRKDEQIVCRLFDRLRPILGPVGTGKALHVLAPSFFPLWDSTIATDFYGVSKDATGYFQFMTLVKQQVANLPDELAPGLTALKAMDEYNYLQISRKKKE